jgi:hypothetical protein
MDSMVESRPSTNHLLRVDDTTRLFTRRRVLIEQRLEQRQELMKFIMVHTACIYKRLIVVPTHEQLME